MPTSDYDPLIGAVLGDRYELVQRSNRGGTSVVYRGVDVKLNRPVAVKVIKSDLTGDPEYVKRFDREARAAAVLSHPNIVAVFDQGIMGDRPYIVMEFIRGQSLRSIISATAPLPPALALMYADEVAKALAAAHDKGIIHRDIKPENVLITTDGQVKVTDFGLAKTVMAPASTASQGFLMGTISYMAPEIQTGTATLASDVYSAGFVLYEMLTGHKPYTGDVTQILYQHAHMDVPPPSEALSGTARARIPDYVDALVVACTRRTVTRRPATGRVLEEDIAKARRTLETGSMRDPGLCRQFLEGWTATEKTPVAPPVRPEPVVPVAPGGATAVKLAPAKPAPAAGKPSGARAATVPGKLTPARPAAGRPVAPRPAPPPPGSKRRAALVGLIVFLAVLLVAGGLGWYLAVGRWTKVPTVAGATEQDAIATLAGANLGLTTLQEYSETVPSGRVIRTDPAQGQRARKGSTVTAYISRGPERYPMPTVVGLSEQEAKDAILSAHLKVGTVVTDWSETVPEGAVIGATQEPGTPLAPGTPIDLTISQGRQPIAITSFNPAQQADGSVTTYSQDEATQVLTDAGFQVVTTEANSATVPAGNVISQTPADGNGYRGDTITLVVSLGPRMIAVPSVRGLGKLEAETTLRQAGFAVDFSYIGAPSLSFGLARNTSPDAGEMAAEGSTVTVYLA